MSGSLLLLFAILLAAAAVGGYLYLRRRERGRKIAQVLDGVELLARWTYTPDEWRAVEEEFGWSGKGGGGEVYISQSAIYIRHGSGDHLIELGGGRVVTHASYSGVAGSPLKLRVRWRIVMPQQEGPDEIRYYKEDYRLPVPARHGEDANRVAAFFTARLEGNLAAYTSVVSDDEPISLFGKDDF